MIGLWCQGKLPDLFTSHISERFVEAIFGGGEGGDGFYIPSNMVRYKQWIW